MQGLNPDLHGLDFFIVDVHLSSHNQMKLVTSGIVPYSSSLGSWKCMTVELAESTTSALATPTLVEAPPEDSLTNDPTSLIAWSQVTTLTLIGSS